MFLEGVRFVPSTLMVIFTHSSKVGYSESPDLSLSMLTQTSGLQSSGKAEAFHYFGLNKIECHLEFILSPSYASNDIYMKLIIRFKPFISCNLTCPLLL